jgi:hypothetical protein
MEITTLLSLPAIFALVESVKYTELIPNRFVPLLAIAFGVVLGLIGGDVLLGLVLGLATSGSYSGVKTLSGK